MNNQIKMRIRELLHDNIKGYILIGATFIAGAILSSVLNITTGSEEEIKMYISDFISNVKKFSVDSQKTFRLSIVGNVKLIAIFFLMSTSVLGGIGLLAYTFIKGFSYGAVLGALIDAFDIKTSIFVICAIIPHLLICVPCVASYLLFCFKKSYTIETGFININSTLLKSFIYAILCVAILCAASFVQAYIEPVFLRMIAI